MYSSGTARLVLVRLGAGRLAGLDVDPVDVHHAMDVRVVVQAVALLAVAPPLLGGVERGDGLDDAVWRDGHLLTHRGAASAGGARDGPLAAPLRAAPS